MKRWPYPRLFAHRGGGTLAPENTMAGMQEAQARGYQAVEFDVKLSRDNVPMLMHDDTLERTTSGSGLFKHLSSAELKQLDAGSWKGPMWAGERIPALDAVMAFLCGQHMTANIEVKPCVGRDEETGRIVAQAAAKLGSTWPPPLLSSFSVAALRAAAHAAPTLPRALLVEQCSTEQLALAVELGCVSLHCAWHDVTPEIVHAAHSCGLRLMAYTVNDADVACRLFQLGLDGIFTDALDRMRDAPT